MNKRLKKAMSIVALVFMALFVVSLTLCCIDIKMLNGSIGFVALFTGFIGISVFAVIKLSSRGEIPEEKGGEQGEKDDNCSGGEAPAAADAQSGAEFEKAQGETAGVTPSDGERQPADKDTACEIEKANAEANETSGKADKSAEKKKGRKAL